jgi:hypothetical protein
MAEKEFIWFLGDDDLLIPNAIEDLLKLIEKNPECDFFWINSFQLDSKLSKKFRYPFDTINLRACSSVVERYVDIVEVISSILITPTKNN